MCQVNTDPMKMQTAFLEVVIPPDIVYEETSGDMMVIKHPTTNRRLINTNFLNCKNRCPKVVQRSQFVRLVDFQNLKLRGSAKMDVR